MFQKLYTLGNYQAIPFYPLADAKIAQAEFFKTHVAQIPLLGFSRCVFEILDNFSKSATGIFVIYYKYSAPQAKI